MKEKKTKARDDIKIDSKKPLKQTIIEIIAILVIAAVMITFMVVLLLSNAYVSSQELFMNGKYDAFVYEFNLSRRKDFNIPEELQTVVPSSAFDGCKKIEFNEYEGCKYIGTRENDYYLLVSAVEVRDSYEIHPQTKSICNGAFMGIKGIDEFIVPKENECFVAIDGSLYTKDVSRMLHYATGRSDTEFVIPKEVKSIDDYAFYYDFNLKSVTLPKHLQRIGECAFGFTLFDTINIPNSAVVIGDGAFANSGLKTITYNYSVEEN